jgi:hypothetical protein
MSLRAASGGFLSYPEASLRRDVLGWLAHANGDEWVTAMPVPRSSCFAESFTATPIPAVMLLSTIRRGGAIRQRR